MIIQSKSSRNSDSDYFEHIKRIVDETLTINDAIRVVGIISKMENAVISKIKPGKIPLVTQGEEDRFAITIQKIYDLQNEFNKSLGETRFMCITRDKVGILVYYFDNFVVYVSCEPTIDRQEMIKISNRIEQIIVDATIHLD